MLYEYKPKNKFPHVILFHWTRDSRDTFDDINQWMSENIGNHKKDWLCGTGITREIDGKELTCYPHSFKILEHAMAFKLMWG